MDKLRTVGLKERTHRALKTFCAQEGLTMTEAVDHLLEVIKKERETNGARETDGTGVSPGNKGKRPSKVNTESNPAEKKEE